MTTSFTRGAAALTAAVSLSFALAACGEAASTATSGTGTETTATSSGDPAAAGGFPTTAEEVQGPSNEADVTFAQGMLPHHRQAVMMSELAADQAEDPEVLAIAEEIAAAQEPEIQTLTALLEAWAAEVPADDMSMEGMTGMMSPEDMTALGSAEGAEFDEMFLQMMVEHHEGAVDMAETELEEGENPTALELARTIIAAQVSEIERMQGLLAS